MIYFPPTIILRHRKENLKKCSLRGLEPRSDCLFFTYPLTQALPDLSSYVLLTLDAPILSPEDSQKGIFIIDGTWRYADLMLQQLPYPRLFTPRSLPSHYQTAYPRKQSDCPDPERGLASVEALFLAYLLTHRDTEGLLKFYYWRNLFLEKNKLMPEKSTFDHNP